MILTAEGPEVGGVHWSFMYVQIWLFQQADTPYSHSRSQLVRLSQIVENL
jgi:hypothetical protein